MKAHGHRPGRHDPATDEVRMRVLAAARVALIEQTNVAAVSVDSIAARAGVARTIVHQQFGTTAGLLEALFDQLTEHGGLADLPRALDFADPFDTLAEVVGVYARFWNSERESFRRLKGVAALDAELRDALRARDEHRREGLRNLARRLGERGVRIAQPLEVLFALTSFELLDQLAGPDRALTEVVPLVQRLSRAAFRA